MQALRDENRITTILAPSSVVSTTLLQPTVTPITGVNPLNVAIVDGSGVQITSFGGGTQYTEGDTDTTISGTAMLMEGAGNALVVAQGTAADGLLVNLGANNDISGTVTANLGATDNAVLDDIAASVDAIETAVEGTLTVTGGGGGTEYTEDVATANPIVGTATMIERDDALSTVTPIEGDNIGLRGTAEGALWTQDFNSDGILADTTAIKTSLETAGGQLVNLGANNDVTITGTATVDLGVNNDVTVTSGAVTATLSATDNAVLDDIALDTEAIKDSLETVGGQVVNLGTNNDVTVTGTVDLGATDNAVLDAIEVDTTTIAGAVSGTEMQVDVLTMPTVAVTGTFWQATQPVSLASVPSHAVTNAGTFAVQDSQDVMLGTDFSNVLGTGSLVLATQADDLVNTTDTLLVSSFGYVFDGTTWDRLKGDSTDGVLVNLGANNDISGTVTANLSATDNAVLDDIAAKLATIDADTSILAAGVSTEYQVDIVGALPAGTNAIGKLAANSGVDIGDVDVTSMPGTGVEDAGETAGGTLLMTGSVRRDTPASSAGTTGDNATLNTDALGKLYVHPAPTELDLATLATAHVKKYYTSAGAVTDGIIWSPAAGKRWYVTDISINVSAAATITLEDDLAAGDSAIWKAEIAANGGWSHAFTTPWFSGEDAADLIITTDAGNIYVSCVGYEI